MSLIQTRLDSAFKSQRPDFRNIIEQTYNTRNHNDVLPDLSLRSLPASIQYTKIRYNNGNWNPAFYGKSMINNLRPELDESIHTQGYKYMNTNNNGASINRNGSILRDPKNTELGMGNQDKSLIYMTKEMSMNIPKKYQPSGFQI